jgi:hypothetical protein
MAGSQAVSDRTLHSWQKALLSVYEDVPAAWRPIRTVTDVRVVEEVEEGPPIPEFRQGQEINIDQHNISRRLRLGFKAQIIADPYINLKLTQSGTLVHSPGATDALIYLYNFAGSPIFLPAGTQNILPNSCGATPGPANAAAAAVIAGGVLPTPVGVGATWNYYITCVYDDVESGNDNAIPIPVFPHEQSAEVAPAFANPPDDSVVLTWAQDNTIGIPDAYRIYRENSTNIGIYDYIGETTLLNFVDDGAVAPGGAPALMPDGVSLVVADILGVPDVPGADYNYSATRQQLDRIVGGGIASYRQTLVACSITHAGKVAQDLGLGTYLANYDRVRLEQLREITGVPTGLTFEFERVKTNGAGVTLSLLEKELSTYDAVEWECFYDDASGRFGVMSQLGAALADIT